MLYPILWKKMMFSTKNIKQHDITWAAKHSAFPSEEYITFYNILTWKMVILNCNNISQFYCIFDQINVALVRLFTDHKLLNGGGRGNCF